MLILLHFVFKFFKICTCSKKKKKKSILGVLTCHSKAAGVWAFHREEQRLGILAGGEFGNQCRCTGLG